MTGTLQVDGTVAQGSRARVSFELGRSVRIRPGMRFALREGGHTIGAGYITGVA